LKVIHEIGHPIQDNAGQVAGFIGTAQDITRRKQREAKLRQLAAIVESSEDAIISKDLDGRIRTWNRAAERILGYRAKEAIGQNMTLLIPENLQPTEFALLERVRKGERIQHYETVRRKNDGTLRPVSLTISPVKDAAGKIVGASKIMRDLSERQRAEKALRESEGRYRSLFENMMDGFAYCRMLFKEGRPQDFIHLEVNQMFENLTGLRNATGRKASAFFSDLREIEPEFLERCGRVALTGQAERFEIHSPGLKRWFSVSAYCPKKEHFAVVIHNITERKQAEAKVQRLAAIVESSEDAIISHDLEGRIQTWNRAAEHIFGYRAKEVIGQNIALLIPEDIRPGEGDYLEELGKGGRIQHYETIRRKKDGTPLPVSLAISPVRDAAGKIAGASKIMRDLSERQRAEKALWESEMRYRSLFENMREAFMYCRVLFENGQPQDFIYLEVNQMYEKLTGLRNVVGRKASEVIPGLRETYQELLERYGRVALTGQPERFEFHNVALKRWFSISAYCPKKEHFIAVIENITERKQAEKRMQMFSQEIVAAREEERRHVSDVLHQDVGSLAVGISAYLDAMEKDLRSAKPGAALQWIKRTRKLFEKSVARLKGLAVVLRPPELDAIGLRAALRQYFIEMTQRGKVRIHFGVPRRGCRVPAKAATILFRVAQEAVTNAIRHGHAKHVDVDLRRSKEEFRLTIGDDGMGFDVSAQRARVTSQLGLRVMEEMATSAGGDFSVESGRGRGTTVRLSLPLGLCRGGDALCEGFETQVKGHPDR
jgi:PAS domain S-box-containing protein